MFRNNMPHNMAIIAKIIMLTSILLVAIFGQSAWANCSFVNTITLKALLPASHAWQAVGLAMQECGALQVEYDSGKLQKNEMSLTENYHLLVTDTLAIVPYLTNNQLHPLDDWVAQYGQALKPSQLIKYQGKIVAIAVTANTQHLMYRRDIFTKLDLAVPKNYQDLSQALKKIKKNTPMEYPLGVAYKIGWNLGLEFINIYLSLGGKLWDQNQHLKLDHKIGSATLSLLKGNSNFADKNYLSTDSQTLLRNLQQGKIAVAHLWASYAEATDDAEMSEVMGKVAMAASPSAKKNQAPASTLWWDGFMIPATIPEKEAEMAFRIALEGIDVGMVTAKDNNKTAIWLIDGYRENALTQGALANIEANVAHYPASSQMLLFHQILGNEIANFLLGKKNINDTLRTVEKIYAQKIEP